MANKISHTTREEVYFLLKLGVHRSTRFGAFGVTSEISRLELLRRYRANMDTRTDWGRIDRTELMRLVDLMIVEQVTHSLSKELDKFREGMLAKENGIKSKPNTIQSEESATSN